MRKKRKIIHAFSLINLAIFLVIFNPFMQGHAAAEAALMPPIDPEAWVADGAEIALDAIIEKEGYKIADNSMAKTVVQSMYDHLDSTGQANWNSVVQAATQADKGPGWLKYVVPTGLIASIGTIMSLLTSDSASGVADNVNGQTQSTSSVTLSPSMPNTVLADNVMSTKVGTYSITEGTGTNPYWYIDESLKPMHQSIGAATGAGSISSPLIKKLTISYASTNSTTGVVSYTIAAVISYINNSGTYAGQRTTGTYLETVTSDIAQQIVNALGATVYTYQQVMNGITQDPSAVTSDTSTQPSNPITVVAPDPSGTTTFNDWNTTVNTDPTATDDTVKPTVEYNNPNPEPTATGTQDTSWWKWLMSPLNGLLSMLQDLWNWLKGCWDNINNWWNTLANDLSNWLQPIGADIAAIGTDLTNWLKPIGDDIAAIGTDLTNWLKPLGDDIAAIGTDLSQWLQPLGDAIGQVVTAVEALPSELVGYFQDIVTAVEALPAEIGQWFMDNIVGDTNNVNWQKLQQAGDFFTTKFPFSLPWDIEKGLHAIFDGISDGTVAPEWDFPLDGVGIHYTAVIKIPDMFLNWSPFFRNMTLILFDVGLIYSMRRLLGGGQ